MTCLFFKNLGLKKYSTISVAGIYFICAQCHLPSSILGRRIGASTAKEPSELPGEWDLAGAAVTVSWWIPSQEGAR